MILCNFTIFKLYCVFVSFSFIFFFFFLLINSYCYCDIKFTIKQGVAKVLKVFKFTGGKSQTVAGLQVTSGKLRTKVGNASDGNAGGYVFRVLRRGEPILDESKGDCELKRIKTTVQEVSIEQELFFFLLLANFHLEMFILFILLLGIMIRLKMAWNAV